MSTLTGGKRWARTRVLDTPLTEYQRYQLTSYGESQAVGDEVRVACRGDVGDVGEDFWLFDADTGNEHAALMHYDDQGHWLGADLVDDPVVLATLKATRTRVDMRSVPFNEFVAKVGRG